jgi:hypothetical protein
MWRHCVAQRERPVPKGWFDLPLLPLGAEEQCSAGENKQCLTASVAMMLLMRLTSPMLIRRVGGGSWHTPRTTAYASADVPDDTKPLKPGDPA